MIIKLALKNLLSRRSSYVIVIFMSFVICLFCISNAVFDSTENGVQTTFISSFTGDVFIRPQSDVQLSLFGDETPVTGELTSIDPLVPYSDIVNYLNNNMETISSFTPQITSISSMESVTDQLAVYVFGVNAEDYLSIMNSIHIIDGEPYQKGNKGVMLNEKTANAMHVTVGDKVQFTVADGPNFRIRSATVSGIYTYDVYNTIFERFVLLDADVVRSLLDLDSSEISEITILDEDTINLFDEDLESLFDYSSDTTGIWDDDNVSISEEIILPTETSASESSTWNFIIIKLQDNVDSEDVVQKLNRDFRKKGWPIQATDWRHAAGSTALYLYWLRVILNIGITVVLIAGFIIINNTLVVSVLDRTQEIGTLRAIGTRKSFISLECMVETFVMSLTSGIFGIILGKLCCHFINNAHIVLQNSFLVQLFGDEELIVYVTSGNIKRLFILVLIIGFIGWIYPVINALKITPVKAMQGGK